jgi:predicted esterase
VLLVLTAPSLSSAQSDPRQLRARIMEHNRKLTSLMREKKYDQAATVCRELIALIPASSQARYNLACCLARSGEPDEAFEALNAAIERGWKGLEHMQADEDLTSLHEDDRWQEAVAACARAGLKAWEPLLARHATSSQLHVRLGFCHAALDDDANAMVHLRRAVALGSGVAEVLQSSPTLASLREKPAFQAMLEQALAKVVEPSTMTIDGRRVVTGRPAGGLRYRIHAGPSGQERRKLLVWLHPSGGSMNTTIEQLADAFGERGYALTVFDGKNFRGWTSRDARRARKTIAALGELDAVDGNRPVLLGYSAGGQLALRWWGRDANAFGGIIVDAAYPILQHARPYRVQPPPADANAAAPVLALVGQADNGAKVWQNVEPTWRKAGVSVEVLYVPGAGHTWLIRGKYLRRTLDWLAERKD